jgi:nitrate reductase NapA
MWVEKNGMVGNSERRTQQWFKHGEPPGEARDDAWQTIAVARKLFERGHPGMRDKDGQLPVPHDATRPAPRCRVGLPAHYYDVNVDEQLFEEYRRFTRFKHKDLAPYAEYVRARGLRWPVVRARRTSGARRATASSRAKTRTWRPAGASSSTTRPHDDRAQVWIHPYENRPRCPTRVPVLAVHRPRARALAHRLDDHARAAAAPRDARSRTSS